MDVGFLGDDVPDMGRAEIRHILTRIAWPNEQPERLTVRRQLSGGRSGGQVLQVDVERRSGPLQRRVVKINRWSEVLTEWQAFQRFLDRRPSAVLTPVETASESVIGPNVDISSGGRAAIVYVDVSDYASSDEAPRTLEDVVRTAISTGEPGSAVDLVTKLMDKLRIGMHRPVAVAATSRTLMSANRGLGTDLVLVVDQVTPHGPWLGDPPASELDDLRRWPQDVLVSSTTPPAQRPEVRAITEGDRVLLEGLEWRRDGNELVTWADDVTVRVRAAESADPWILSAATLTEPRLAVFGRVEEIRAEAMTERIDRLVGGVCFEPSAMIMDGMRMQHPMSALCDVLSRDVRGRATAHLVHGDLNPRNVMVVDTEVYLIDFALTEDGRSPCWDGAWLETCLLRDVIAPELPGAELLQVQRLLGALTRGAAIASEPDVAAAASGDGLSSRARAAVEVLWAVRRGTRLDHPGARAGGNEGGDSVQPWWQDYLAQLTLAACRGLKWKDADQTTASVRASAVTAAVAAEWLGPRPCQDWPLPKIQGLIRLLAPELVDGDPWAAADVLACVLVDFVRAEQQANSQGPGALDLEISWHALEAARASIVRRAYKASALEATDALRDAHDIFIALNAFIPLNALSHSPPPWTSPTANGTAELWPSPADYPADGDDFPWRDPKPSRHSALDAHDAEESKRTYGFEAARELESQSESADAMALLMGRRDVVVLGAAGSGKSTVARELQYLLARAVSSFQEVRRRPDTPAIPPLMPVIVRGREVERALRLVGDERTADQLLRAISGLPPLSSSMLAIGGVHLTVDALNQLTLEEKQRVAHWILRLRQEHPEVPVMICHRSFGFDPDMLPFPSVALQNVTDDQVRSYLRDFLRLSAVDEYEWQADQLTSMLLDNRDNRPVRDLAGRPLFLWMIAERYAEAHAPPDNIGALFEDFSRWFLEERHHRRPGELPPAANQFSFEQKLTLLELLGVHLVEHGNVTDLNEAGEHEVIRHLSVELRPHSDSLLEEVLRSEMLSRSESGLAFYHHAFQEYFASRVFAREAADDSLLRERTLRFDWREPLRMMLGFSTGRRELVERVIGLLLRANPVDAAYLLRSCEVSVPEVVAEFLDKQRRVLENPNAGKSSWSNAAEALRDYGSAEAIALLSSCALSPGQAMPARVVAYEQLLARLRGGRDEQEDQEREDTARRVTQTLAVSTSDELRARAIRAAGDHRLTGLVLPIAAALTPKAPWLVQTAAYRALSLLGEQVPDEQHATYLEACVKQVALINDALRTRTNGRDELVDEKCELLEVLVNEGLIDVVLPERLSYDLRYAYDWQRSLSSENAAYCSSVVARALLRGEVETTAVPQLVTASDDVAIAAATLHVLAKDADLEILQAVVTTISADSSAPWLLAAAQLAEFLPEDPGGHLEGVIRTLIRRLSATTPDTDCLGTLLRAFPGDKVRQASLIALAEMRVAEADFPLPAKTGVEAAWFHQPSLSDNDLDALLTGNDEDRMAAIALLARTGENCTMAVHRHIKVSELARTRLEAFAATTARTTRERQWAVDAAMSIGAVQVLRLGIALLDEPSMLEVIQSNWSQYEPTRLPRLAFLLPTLGRLARTAYEEGHTALAAETLQAIMSFPASKIGETTELCRCIGLAYLGLWRPLLMALPAEGGPWYDAARNALQSWTPGPFTPPGDGVPAVVAGWIAQYIETAHPLSPRARSGLMSLKRDLETRLRRYILPPTEG